MTLPDEAIRAVESARVFLVELLRPDITPRVPRYVRDNARAVLRHFPWSQETLFQAVKSASRGLRGKK